MNNPTHAHPSSTAPTGARREVTTPRADLVIRRTTIATVLFLATVAAVVSYGHMHELAVRHGEETWIAALLPLSVDGMIVAASMALLSDSRRGRNGGILPWTLLVIASGASLAANVAAAHPALVSRVISAWPPFALIGAYEMLMRQIRHSVTNRIECHTAYSDPSVAPRGDLPVSDEAAVPPADMERPARQLAVAATGKRQHAAEHLQRQAWQWALTHRLPTGELPSGEAIAGTFQRSARWGRMVKNAGFAGQFDHAPRQEAA